MESKIIIFPGTNREKDMAMALEKVTGKQPDFVWHKETDLGKPDLIVLPGGFSYGDYLRCGAMAAHSPIMKEVINHAQRGTRIFGVCNGFQMLIETQLLPGALLKNQSLKFICKHVHLKTETTDSAFTSKLDQSKTIKVPIAHGDGNYFANDTILKSLKDNDQIAFRYSDESCTVNDANNPNGSSESIAGILNTEKTILGMMPHPENATQPWQDNDKATPLFEGIVSGLMS